MGISMIAMTEKIFGNYYKSLLSALGYQVPGLGQSLPLTVIQSKSA